MRITRSLCVLFIVACVWAGAGHGVVAGQTKYGVTVTTVKPAELAKAKTYVWKVGQPSFNKTVDAMIVAAVDRELGARGFTKLPSGKSDVVVSYATLSRTDVDLKTLAKGGTQREFNVGMLVVDLSDAASQQLFRARMDTPIERDPATIEAAINEAVKALFEKYPAPPKR